MQSESVLIAEALKEMLKQEGITYATLAKKLGLSESTIKRIFSKRNFDLRLLEKICEHLNLSFFDLAARARSRGFRETYALNLDQEKVLTSDPKLYFFFWLVVNRVPVKQIATRFKLKPEDVQRFLLKLDKIRILKLREGQHFTLLVPRNITWNEGGPIERVMIAKTLPEFLKGKFSEENHFFRHFIVKASPETISKYQAKMRSLTEDMFREMITTEATLSTSKSVGFVIAFGPIQFSVFDVLSRKEP